jgi:MtN3 and saliva related transmembrane protein
MKKFFKAYMIFIGIFGQLVFFAQAYKIYATRSASDVSLLGFSTGLLSVTSWLIYGVVIKDVPLVVANTVACVGALTVVVGILMYR